MLRFQSSFFYGFRTALASLICCVLTHTLCAEDWPQWRGIHRDATVDDGSLVRQLDQEIVERRWSVPVGPGYSGPTIADGRVYLTDRSGDRANTIERVFCVRADNGQLIWEHSYPVRYTIGYDAAGPRAAVTVSDGKAYSVGGMGRFICFNAATGEPIWSHDLKTVYNIRMPGWGITGSPLVYDDLVIQIVAGEGNACVVAFDTETGKERWRALDEKAGYSSPVIIRQGQQDVAVCWTGESVSGLNPKTGDVLWAIEMKPWKMPIGVPTPVIQDNLLYVSSFYDGSLLIEFDPEKPEAKTAWRRRGIDERNTDALHCMISNPIIKGDSIFGADSYGEFRCLDLTSGDRIWEDLTVVPKARWATVHIIRNGEDEIILNDQGELLFTTLTRKGIEIRSRSKLLNPTRHQLNRRDGVVWSAPAIANGFIFARNDEELVCASLQK